MRALVALAILVALGGIKLPIERDLTALHRHEHFRGVEFNLDLRESLGNSDSYAALRGFERSSLTRFSSRHSFAWEDRMGPDLVCCSGTSHAAAPGDPVLDAAAAHGLERKRGGDERPHPAAACTASQSTARLFSRSEKILERG